MHIGLVAGSLFFSGLFVCATPAARAQETGDANCDGTVDSDDLRALIERIFAPRECGQADPNLDAVTSAADLTGEIHLFSFTPTPTETIVPSPTETPMPALGPRITYLGIAASGGRLQPISDYDDTTGIPIFNRAASAGFKIVIEAAPGVTGSAVGQTVMNSKVGDPTAVPDLQMESTRDLGNGNAIVCSGGVPGIDPPRFATEQFIADAMNDFACRFGVATIRNGACTIDDFDITGFAAPDSRIQFCRQVSSEEAFGPGDTMLTVRLRDRIGNVGDAAQIIVRLPGSAPSNTPTRTGTPTIPPTRTRTATITETRPPTATPTRTSLPPTATFTTTALFTATRTPTRPTPTVTPSSATSATITPTKPTATRTPTSLAITPTRTATGVAATATRTPTGPASTATRTPSGGGATPTRTPTLAAASPTRTRTVTATATPTAGAATGPVITFMGIARADNRYNPEDLIGTNPLGVPIYRRPLGTGFLIVVEGKRGSSNRPVGSSSFNSDPGDPTALPDLQILVSRPLGDGSTSVCDTTPPEVGGVPAVDPPTFSQTQAVANAINDLACRFVDGTGQPRARPLADACILGEDGQYGFFAASTTTQFCSAVIPQPLRVPTGDTLVTARLRDTSGNVGPVAQIILRVAN